MDLKIDFNELDNNGCNFMHYLKVENNIEVFEFLYQRKFYIISYYKLV